MAARGAQRSLWGYEVGEAVEIKVWQDHTTGHWRDGPFTWIVATVTSVGGAHRGLNVQEADTGRTVAIGDPRVIRKLPRGEDLIRWLDE